MENLPDCVACAVRQLTEGVPDVWNPEREGENVTGVVLRTGHQETTLVLVPFIDLWIGGTSRIRVIGLSANLTNQIKNLEARVGDRVTATYEGRERGVSGREYEAFRVEIQRGHH